MYYKVENGHYFWDICISPRIFLYAQGECRMFPKRSIFFTYNRLDFISKSRQNRIEMHNTVLDMRVTTYICIYVNPLCFLVLFNESQLLMFS